MTELSSDGAILFVALLTKPSTYMSKKINGGFEFYRSDEQIVRFMKVPAIDKLRWLDTCRQLIFSIEDKNFHKIRQKFRRGEI